jgi:hypothetical protein
MPFGHFFIYSSQSDQKDVIKVQVCPAVRKIDPFLLSKYLQLRSVELLEGLEEIGQCAFADCCLLNGIVILQSVKGILNWAFECCIQFTTVKLPLGLKEIAVNAST